MTNGDDETTMGRLMEYIETLGRTPVIPLMGYPGTRLTQSSIKLNEFNWGLHAWTIQSLYRRFEPDGVFFLMDLAIEANGMGLQVRFPLQESPSVEIHPVKDEQDLDQFKAVDILKDCRAFSFIKTIEQLRELLPPQVTRGAYVTGPFTLAGLLCGANDIAVNVVLSPELVFKVLELATSVVTRYALALERAGAQVIAILDPTAVILGPKQFDEFAGRFSRIVAASLKEALPVYHVCGNTMHLMERFGQLGVEALSLDSVISLSEAAKRVPDDVVLIGNINPVETMLQARPAEVREQVLRLRDEMTPFKNFILSTGCDLPRDVPFENIEALIAAGKE